MRALLRARQSAFTLIELLVATAVTLILITAALAVIHRIAAVQRRQQSVELTRRGTARALAQLASEVRRAGLGCPTGTRLDSSNPPFPPAILRATTHELVFVADLPRPNSDFHGVSALASDQGTFPALPAGRNWVAIFNELSGTCVPRTASPVPCTTNLTSLVFQGDLVSCNDDESARTCPWGLNRYQPGETLILANGLGQWFLTQVGNPVHDEQENRRVLRLTSQVTSQLTAGTTPGFVSTPDRILYRLQQAGSSPDTYLQLVRKQCWNWGTLLNGPPNLAALSDLDSSSLCDQDTEATDFEVLLEHDIPPAPMTWGQTLQFTYHDVNGNQLIPNPGPDFSEAELRTIRQVRVQVAVRRSPAAARASPQGFIEYNTSLLIDLRN